MKKSLSVRQLFATAVYPGLLKKNKGFVLFFLLVLSSAGAFAQQKVTGRVISGDSAVSSATVQVLGSGVATQTDAGGNFTLNAAAGTQLEISHVGYVTQNVKVTGSGRVDVQLLPSSSQSLNEVVVVGYGTQKRSDVTGAVASVPKARLSQLPVTNVLQAVEGIVPGLNVTTTSSVPGSTPAVLVRGQNSITAGTGPLYVVDGIPLSKSGGGINDINPNDVASIEVLKDASATAIYGVNGTNGVILITTKRGTTGKPVIRYNGYAGAENLAHILEPRSPAEYLQKYKDYLSQTGQTQTGPVPNAYELPNYTAGKTTDWVKEATQQGIMQDHNVSISGGASNVKYYVSGEYMHQKGVVKGYQYQRASVRSNLDINVTSFLTVGTSMYFSNNNYDGGRTNLLFATAMSPYGQEYNANGTYAIYPMYPELLYTNPMLGLYSDVQNRSSTLQGNGYADLNLGGILKGLKFRLNAGYTYLPTRLGSYTGRNGNNTIGGASTSSSETNSYTLENILSYNKDFGKHHIDFTGLYSSQERKYITYGSSASGFINDLLSFYNLGAGSTISGSSYRDRYALNSQMARINYGFDSRYLLTLTARRDGSSVIGANTSKYGVFPSLAFGWNIMNESFMKGVGKIDNLKIRGSYGKTGNEAISVYQTITTDNLARYPFGGLSSIGVLAGNLGNSNLHWESTTGFNLGIDFAILKNRISGSIDAYHTNTNGLILNRNLPIITGYSRVLDNLGKTANRGIEILVTTRNIESKDFRWESSFNFAANQNKILDLYGDRKSDVGNRWFIGKPISVIYDYKMIGIWQTGQDASKQDPGAKAGDLKFADLNHDGKITADSDRVILGQTAPKWTGGMTNTFHYKNFHLSIFVQTAQGITKNNTDLNYVDESGRRNTPAEIGYWTTTNGDNTRPALSYTNTRGYGYASNASYTRLKDITLSYSLPQAALDKAHLGGLTFYVSGRNLYTFTPWVGWDPENNYLGRGVTSGSTSWTDNYPTTRSVVFGANLSLR